MNIVKFTYFKMHSIDYQEGIKLLLNAVEFKEPRIIIHLNIWNYYLSYYAIDKYKVFKEKIYFVFEGIAMKFGALLLGKSWNKDINGTDLAPLVFENFPIDKSMFFVGSKEKFISLAVENTLAKFPNLNIVGFHHGYIDENNCQQLIDKINLHQPDLLLLGMGMEKEILFLHENFHLINENTVIWCVGGLFDFLSERFPRAPKIIRSLRLEWLFRWSLEPINKFKRHFYLSFWFLLHLSGIYLKRKR